MVFNSYIFILAFLPFVVMVYHFLKFQGLQKLSKVFLILLSALFVLYANTYSLIFLFFSIVLNCSIGSILINSQNDRKRKVLCFIGVLVNILSLVYFKYTYFIVDNLSTYAKINFQIEEIIIPLGISFITFQQISYLVDAYRRKIEENNVIDYILYVVYFPKLVQGPITKYNDFLVQLNGKKEKETIENVGYGFWIFIQGLAKKVLLADMFAKAVNWGIGTSIEHMTSLDAVIVVLSFTFQIYFDFSGYSSMAIGVSKMLDINLPDNFDSPYQAKSVIEFWKRWHITLTDFLREYLYFPLGGSRKGKLRTYVNVMLIFLVSGLWHGAAWTYVVWGCLHGVAYCLNKIFYKQWERLGGICQWLFTFLFINISWVFFRALSVSQACDILLKIIRMENISVSEALLQCFYMPEVTFLTNRFEGFSNFWSQFHGIEMVGFLWIGIIIVLNIKDRYENEFKPTIMKCICSILLLSWSVVSLSTVVEFIYGGF